MQRLRIVLGLLLIASSTWASARPIVVSPEQLLANPTRYSGKQVSVRAYYESDGHSPTFASKANAAYRIYADFEHPLLPVRSITQVPLRRFVRVVGRFEYKDLRPTKPIRHYAHGDVETIPAGFGSMAFYN